MLTKKWKLMKNQKGLTLVELLAVIVILGVIAAIAIPSIGGVIKSSKLNADKESESLLRETAIRYMTDLDPDGDGKKSDGSAVNGLTFVAAGESKVTVDALVDQGYLRATPRKQSADTSTTYKEIPVKYTAGKGWDTTATEISTTP
ncbi:type II secretion system protein [Paenibacillus allorhizosphaerae]|uniref:Prepilin-type N-terminal cleavage/methylation domain-containing protein n=1 Tax=Paenibacillus allorhizosphaerae TaxID=2849866 RepID=A0ABM8VL83_9BACL|nr:prepilin-type N-terminal cleavage/methylation domain-containing protein [Paenibacillus allorhizosphaerae]CAG7648275.1 hypothetical protein PAECIP111802_04168 [Paenibacillus allorhizosphaerae]